MNTVSLVLCFILASMQPLSEQQIERLHTAVDGRDHREEAFVALKENLRAFDGEPGDAPRRVSPDWNAMVDSPGEYRGDWCALSGVIQQITPLSGVHDDVMEWFIRNDAGRPILVYVVQAKGQSFEALEQFELGDEVRVIGRFYKRVNFVARDGVERSYPALVSAPPQRPNQSDASHGLIGPLLPALFIIMILLLVFVILFVYVRRSGAHRAARPWLGHGVEDEPGVDDSLPGDPAEALAELRRQANTH